MVLMLQQEPVEKSSSCRFQILRFSGFTKYERPSLHVHSLLNLYFHSSSRLNKKKSFKMEEGTKSKRTVFVGGLGDDIDEAALYESFQTFG